MVSCSVLSNHSSVLLSDPTLYKSLIEELINDKARNNLFSKYIMSISSLTYRDHMELAVKRVLIYLKGTAKHELYLYNLMFLALFGSYSQIGLVA